MKKIKIAVVGLGYVGLSNSIILAQKNSVTAIDIDIDKVNAINERKSPFLEQEMKSFLKNEILDLKATLPSDEVYAKSEILIISTPTNYDETTGFFSTNCVEKIIKNALSKNFNITIIIKSTVPVGFTDKMIEKYQTKNIYFVPEFLREGNALHDNLYPSRILIGGYGDKFKLIESIFKYAVKKKNVIFLTMNPAEAESSKLFSNTYLAMRVAFFNELDSFAYSHNLKTENIIKSLSLDPRIGFGYNNPSFGYGGYCLPKDTKQLLTNYKNVPQKLISATIESNHCRKKFIAEEIIKLKPKVVGIYRLLMKKGSDNFRESSIQDIIDLIALKNIKVIIFEPLIKDRKFHNFEVFHDFEEFENKSNIILLNRIDNILNSKSDKVFTRDIFKLD